MASNARSIYAARFGEGGDARGRKRGPRAARSLRAARPADLGPQLHGLAGAAREAAALSRRARALAASRARSASSSNPAARSSSGCSRRRLRGLDFSYAVSSGNELDLDLADYINFHGRGRAHQDHRLHGRGHPPARGFMAAAAKALAARKPIAGREVGRSERGKRSRGEPHRRASPATTRCLMRFAANTASCAARRSTI